MSDSALFIRVRTDCRSRFLSGPARPREHAPQQVHFPPLSTGLRLPTGFDPEAHKDASVPYYRLFVTNLSYTLNEADLRAVFEPFGQVDFVDIHMDYVSLLNDMQA